MQENFGPIGNVRWIRRVGSQKAARKSEARQ
jgi:hypothetical protein